MQIYSQHHPLALANSYFLSLWPRHIFRFLFDAKHVKSTDKYKVALSRMVPTNKYKYKSTALSDCLNELKRSGWT